jgi:hypothetical protein
VLAHGEFDVFEHSERGKQRALLEKHAPAAFDGDALLVGKAGVILAQNLDSACRLGEQADDGAQRDRLARTRRADDAQHLATTDIEAETVDDLAVAKGHDEVADGDDGIGECRIGHD